MHIEDGILPPRDWGMWYGISVVFIYAGISEIKKRIKVNLYYKPFLSMVGVAVFVISAMHFPVPVTGLARILAARRWRPLSWGLSPRL